jgi:hypothetical protein
MNDSDIGIRHNNYLYKGKTQYWRGTDSKELFDQNCLNSEKKELLQSLGWLDPDVISYQFNSFGFRDDEFDNRVSGIALGCSHTEGIGIPEFYAWPRVLSRLIGTYIWNLGVGGSSIDTTFRLLDHWLPKLNPKFVVLCVPSMNRVELFDDTDPVSIMPTTWQISHHLHNYYKVWSASEYNAQVLKRKNLLAMQQLCDQAKIPLRYLDHTIFQSHNDARDLQHHGVDSHNNFAHQMYNLL